MANGQDFWVQLTKQVAAREQVEEANTSRMLRETRIFDRGAFDLRDPMVTLTSVIRAEHIVHAQ